MKTRKRVLPALLASLLAAAAPAAGAAPFSGFYAFGDSLTDAGYYRPFLAGLGLPPEAVAVLGRFTTNPGPVWSELVSQYYGMAPAPSNVPGGNIFAQGGARVALPSAATPPGLAQRPASTQIDEYLAASGGHADPGALYAIWAGSNDILQNLTAYQMGAIGPADLQANVLGAATAEVGEVARLQAAGARYILVFSLPDIGGTLASQAAGPAVAGAVTQLSAGYNTTLYSGLAAAGVRAIPVDTFSFLSEVAANPSAYGIANTTSMACGPFPPITTASSVSAQFCLPANFVAPDAASTYLFADAIHPTSAVHALLAQFAESLIEGPSQYSLLAEAPLRARAAHVRGIVDALGGGRAAPVGKVTVFAAGDGARYDIDSGGGTVGFDSDLRSATVGIAARVSEAFTLGAAYGQDRADATFGGDAGGFRTREQAFSLFGGVRWGGFYGTGVFTVGNIDFRDVHRNIVLGPSVRTATASPDGSNGSAFVALGYDFPLGRLRVGPTLGFASQNVTVNAFDESGAASADLHVAEQTRRSEIWSLGAQASADMGAWTPWVRVTAEREQRDDPRFVTASPRSLATGNAYDIPAYAPDTSYVTGAVGVNARFGPRLGLAVSYFRVSGRSGTKEDGITGMLSYRF